MRLKNAIEWHCYFLRSSCPRAARCVLPVACCILSSACKLLPIARGGRMRITRCSIPFVRSYILGIEVDTDPGTGVGGEGQFCMGRAAQYASDEYTHGSEEGAEPGRQHTLMLVWGWRWEWVLVLWCNSGLHARGRIHAVLRACRSRKFQFWRLVYQ